MVNESVAIIDFRARPNTQEYMALYEGTELWARFGYPRPPAESLEAYIESLNQNGIGVAVFTGRQNRTGGVSNDYIAQCVASHPDRIVGFAGIDPLRGPGALDDVDHAIRKLGLRGLSFDPPDAGDVRGRGYDDERVMYPLYERAVELQVPVVLTVGPLMTPYTSPRAIERIAADFPELAIVCSHGGWPSVTEWIGLAYRYANVFIEPSIYIYLPGGSALVEAGNTILKDKLIYASAFPFNGLDSIERFRALGFKDDVLRSITVENAERLLGVKTIAGLRG